jgi:hypothetical protein
VRVVFPESMWAELGLGKEEREIAMSFVSKGLYRVE